MKTSNIDFGTANGLLTINLDNLTKNYSLLQNKVGDHCYVSGVIKADGYGLGVKPIAQTLKNKGCQQFFVATLDEALTVRAFDTTTPIAVFSGLMKGYEEIYPQYNITPILNTPNDIEQWSAFSKSKNRRFGAILHFDTGMNRLGLNTAEWKHIQDNDSLNFIDVLAIISHFVSADEQDQTLTQIQTKRFDDIASHFPKTQKSLANSSGIFRDKRHHHDLVRPGYSLYGGNPTPEKTNPMNPVITLNVRILQIRDCLKNETIGYGATHKFNKKTRTATIGLGYNDGLLRSIGNSAKVFYKGQACPIIGRISMDATTIDVSHIQGMQAQQGDAIEILGAHQSIDDLADAANTIGYEILTCLGSRYKRYYSQNTP